MKDLKNQLLTAVAGLLPQWTLVKSEQGFVRQMENHRWHLHLTFINHSDDFDITADVAVSHYSGKERICIVGAELGNIQGTGQRRWTIRSAQDVKMVANSIVGFFSEIGDPFLDRYSNKREILHVLQEDPNQAKLISPILADHKQIMAAIEKTLD